MSEEKPVIQAMPGSTIIINPTTSTTSTALVGMATGGALVATGLILYGLWRGDGKKIEEGMAAMAAVLK